MDGGTMTGNLVLNNDVAISSKTTAGTGMNCLRIDTNDGLILGDRGVKIRMYTTDNPRVYIDGSTEKILYHQGNVTTLIADLLNYLYPVGSIKMTANNVNPSTKLGGTWTLISQGRAIVGVGTGTDSNSKTKAFTAGNNAGEYEHTMTISEIATHFHEQRVSAPNGVEGVARIDYNSDAPNGQGGWFDQGIRTHNAGDSTPFNVTQPTFGVYIWQRTA